LKAHVTTVIHIIRPFKETEIPNKIIIHVTIQSIY